MVFHGISVYYNGELEAGGSYTSLTYTCDGDFKSTLFENGDKRGTFFVPTLVKPEMELSWNPGEITDEAHSTEEDRGTKNLEKNEKIKKNLEKKINKKNIKKIEKKET